MKPIFYYPLYALFNGFFIKHCSIFVPEIAKVRASLFQINGVKKEPLLLPEADGMVTTLTEKVYVPVKEHPDVSIEFLYNLTYYQCWLIANVDDPNISCIKKS